ncbi:uncharacterized protein LOC114873327 [Osmia bicornis bicornis]|uniref:uncharacterized protein LOC114873327 n=1 Tax=Osmia bicornis bicornis TaxID=1437191 RepID=UPI0010F73C3E|nr:uncharacterized protein LOC114873327 [Osmia bicornis bicornis]
MNSTNRNSTMSVEEAIKKFTDIIRSLNAVDQQTFLSFIADNWKPEEAKIQSISQNCTDGCHNKCSIEEDQLRSLKNIVLDIRNRVPFDGILPTEQIVPPTIGENSDCDDASTIHVDAFLYDNKEVDELIEQGEVDNLYCANCGSNNVKEYNIISHSLSVSGMLYILHTVLPSLENKTVLDIGSRLGAVLYGTHIVTSAKRIIGVEMNKELCMLQYDIVHKYKMNDRIEIVNKRIEECPEIVQKSDIIIMNNPFEFYVAESVHIEIWKFLKANIQSGTILVTRPPIETTFKTLKTGISISKWLRPYESEKFTREPQVFGSLILDPNEHSDIRFYEVL